METRINGKSFSYTNGLLTSATGVMGLGGTAALYYYDGMGNPTQRTNGITTQTFTWVQGRMLIGVAQDSGNYATYQYDSNGLRRQKQVCTNGQIVATEYIWANNVLAGFVQGRNTVNQYSRLQSKLHSFEWSFKF